MMLQNIILYIYIIFISDFIHIFHCICEPKTLTSHLQSPKQFGYMSKGMKGKTYDNFPKLINFFLIIFCNSIYDQFFGQLISLQIDLGQR